MVFPKTLAGFYASVFAEKRGWMIAYYLLRIFNKASFYVMPAFLAKFVVGALETKPVGELILADVMPVLVGVGVWILLTVMSDIAYYATEATIYPETKKISHMKMYRYLIDKSVAFYKSHSAGYLQAQANLVINGTWRLMFKYPVLLVSIVFGIVANFSMLFQLNWIFVVLIAAVLMFRVIHATRRMKPLAAAYVDYAEEASVINGKNVDVLSNYLNMKIFGDKRCEEKYIGDYFDKWVVKKRHSLWLEVKFFALPMSLEFLALILMIFLMAYFYSIGQMNLSEIAFAIGAFFSVRSCVANFVWEIPDFMDTFHSANQAFKNLTRTSPDICDVQTGSKTCSYNSMIAFNNVSFKYDDEWVLRDINLCIAKGEKIGIVGTSGSGKTTLVNLLMHLYDVTCGSIEIDGVNIKQFRHSSLKKAVSFVPQESILFNRTLAENISYGVAGATRAQIIRAAKLAQAHDFIMKTDNGYETVVGDRGVKLSGGQRQRITIAHAILKNAPILLLDEATSALDSETEANIQTSINGLMRDRTTIAIAHRLSTLQQMDRIIVMDAGRIVEMGTHKTLMRRRGLYYKLWQRQYSGFM